MTWAKRAEQGPEETSPEELIAAAHAACFCMALSHGPRRRATRPRSCRYGDRRLQPGQGITGSHLDVQGRVPGLDDSGFAGAAATAAAECPVSKALAGVEITHSARLAG